jgi:hypothetical protein
MNWTKIKSSKQVALEGVSVEIERSDTSLIAVTLEDSRGNKLRVRLESYCMITEIPALPKMVEKIALKGTVLGLKVEETFDTARGANDRKEELAGRLDEDKFSLAIEPVQVPEEDLPF